VLPEGNGAMEPFTIGKGKNICASVKDV